MASPFFDFPKFYLGSQGGKNLWLIHFQSESYGSMIHKTKRQKGKGKLRDLTRIPYFSSFIAVNHFKLKLNLHKLLLKN